MGEFASQQDIARIDATLSKMAEAIVTLAKTEERQAAQAEVSRAQERRMDAMRDKYEQDMKDLRNNLFSTRSDLQKWVNRGFGAWSAFCLIWAFLQFFYKQ